MAYELRVAGRDAAVFGTQAEAVAAARAAVQADPDCEPEVIDLATGRPASPAAGRGERDELANKVGY